MCGRPPREPALSEAEGSSRAQRGTFGSANSTPLPQDERILIITMRTITPLKITLCAFLLTALPWSGAQAQNAAPPDSKAVPVIDGGIGPCSAEFTVTDNAGAPVYAANISVHIAYGFMYLRKLDLQIGTSATGQARFTGLPDRTKQGLFFRASEGAREGTAFVDSAKTCKANLTITLEKKP
jgi:hypothetical protein